MLLLVDQDHPAAQFLAVLGLEGLFHVVGRDLDPTRAQFPQCEGRIDDVPGVLHRADAALLIEGPQPPFTADPEPLGDRLDFLVDLGRRDLQFLLSKSLVDQGTVDEQLEDFLPLRATHSSASCWRVMIWPFTIAIGSVGLTGIIAGCESRHVDVLEVLTWQLAWKRGRVRAPAAAPGNSAGGLAVPVPARPPRSRQPGRTEHTTFRDRDPLRSSRGVSPIPLVLPGFPQVQRQSGRDSRFSPETVNLNYRACVITRSVRLMSSTPVERDAVAARKMAAKHIKMRGAGVACTVVLVPATGPKTQELNRPDR